jgi:hypothetical protein
MTKISPETNEFQEIFEDLEDLRLQGSFCFISNVAYSFAGGRRINLAPNGEFAVTFMTPGDPIKEPDAIDADLKKAILKAIEKVKAKNLPKEAS